MNAACNTDNLNQYYNFVDFLREKHLLTNAISAQIKADLSNLSFNDLTPLDLHDERNRYDKVTSVRFSPQDFTSKNFIDNGQFTQWQRGDTIEYQGGSTVYFADRWFGRRGKYAKNLTVQKVNSAQNNNSAMQLIRVEGDEEVYEIGVAQLINSTDIDKLAGKTIMLAAKIRCGSGYSGKTNQFKATIFCSKNSNISILNPFTLGKDSQVVATANIQLTQEFSPCIIYGQIPATTKKIMVTFRTGEIDSRPANSQDYFELMDVELRSILK